MIHIVLSDWMSYILEIVNHTGGALEPVAWLFEEVLCFVIVSELVVVDNFIYFVYFYF